MLTRSGVAKRLGKSIATVRRMERIELHPHRDERGVYRFSPDEVEAVANGSSTGDRSHRIAQLEEHKSARPPADSWPEELRDGVPMERHSALLGRPFDVLEARRRAEQEQRERAEAIWQEVSKQLEDELALREATRALDELAAALESSGAVLDENELSELCDLIDAVEADLG